MILKVNKCEYIENYKIKVYFNNNIVKEVDLEKELWGEVFEPLKNIENFKKFKIDFNTISWPNGADFAPEHLLKIGK